MNEAYNMDCMEYMKTVPDKYFDLVVADPPYGIGIDTKHVGKSGAMLEGGNIKARAKEYHPFDDSKRPEPELFTELLRVSKHAIIWGGNYFADMLGETNCMLVWDKLKRGLDQADCELAWTDFNDKPRVFTFRWIGFMQGDMLHKEERIHPTQKPVKLYAWIFSRYAKEGDKIFDPFLGSGSSRIAAYDAGLDFVGCELDKVYFDLEEERFANHTAQMNLFIDGGNT